MPRQLPALLLLLAGCASAPIVPPPPMTTLSAAEFPGAAALLQGFAAPEERDDWRVGEAALYGLRLERPDGERRWLVRLTLVDTRPGPISEFYANTGEAEPEAFTSPSHRYRVEVFDGDGATLGSSDVDVPFGFFQFDFVTACQDARHPPLDAAATRRVAGAHVALFSFLRILQQDPVLSDVLWQVIDKPSLWSVLTRLGISIGMASDLDLASDEANVLPAPWDRAAVCFPLRITVNGTQALAAEIVATAPVVPMRLGAGIVGITGHRPSDPRVRFAAMVLAATP